jgi:hypothetical protein
MQVAEDGGEPGVREPPGAVGDVGVEHVAQPGPVWLYKRQPCPPQHVREQVAHCRRAAAPLLGIPLGAEALR